MENTTFGARVADAVSRFVGSWPFIIIQSALLIVWMAANGFGLIAVDPYPFTFCNLLLGIQAAYTAPFLLMSADRQSTRDRETLERDLAADEEETRELQALRIEVVVLNEKLDRLLARG